MGTELPPRCVGICPLEGVDLEAYSLTISRNCDGPNPVMPGATTDYLTEIRKDGEVTTTAHEVLITAARTCTNALLQRLIKERKQSNKGIENS